MSSWPDIFHLHFHPHLMLCTHCPAKLQPHWALMAPQMFFSASGPLYLLVPLIFSQIFNGTASFHPLSLAETTYSQRPSPSTLSGQPLPSYSLSQPLSLTSQFLPPAVFITCLCVQVFKPLSYSLMLFVHYHVPVPGTVPVS